MLLLFPTAWYRTRSVCVASRLPVTNSVICIVFWSSSNPVATKKINKKINFAWADEQLPRCLSGHGPPRKKTWGSSWCANSGFQQSCERVVSSLATSDRDRGERMGPVAEPTTAPTAIVSASHQRAGFILFIYFFFEGEDESGLKGSWSVGVRPRWGPSSGDGEWRGRERAATRGLAVLHASSMFDS